MHENRIEPVVFAEQQPSSSHVSDPTLIGAIFAGSSHPLCPGNTGIASSPLPHAYDVSFPHLARSFLHAQVALEGHRDSILTAIAPLPPRSSGNSFHAPNVGRCVTSNVALHTGTSMPIFCYYKVPCCLVLLRLLILRRARG